MGCDESDGRAGAAVSCRFSSERPQDFFGPQLLDGFTTLTVFRQRTQPSDIVGTRSELRGFRPPFCAGAVSGGTPAAAADARSGAREKAKEKRPNGRKSLIELFYGISLTRATYIIPGRSVIQRTMLHIGTLFAHTQEYRALNTHGIYVYIYAQTHTGETPLRSRENLRYERRLRCAYTIHRRDDVDREHCVLCPYGSTTGLRSVGVYYRVVNRETLRDCGTITRAAICNAHH